MLALSNAKINLGLKVLRKRPDLYHDLETIFYPIPFCDVLELIKLDNHTPSLPINFNQLAGVITTSVKIRQGVFLHFATSGTSIECELTKNLCVRAFHAFDERQPIQNSYFLHLHKIIPTGSGLGGGSSNASYTLKLLNKMEGSPLTKQELLETASFLGSDCPFFVMNEPSYATGRGELLKPIAISLKGYFLVVVIPPVHVNTSDAFSGIVPIGSEANLIDAIEKPVTEWLGSVENDFEKTVFKKSPLISDIKNKILKSGAVYASMSGSGSAVFGIFGNSQSLKESFPGCLVVEKQL